MQDRMRQRLAGRKENSDRKLRRQPKMRRAQSESPFRIPSLTVPRTARKRRRRNRRILRLPTAAIKRIVFSSRWISLLLLVLSVGTMVFVGMNESFYLTRIPVEGVASIPPEEIVEASGLGGVHIFSADPIEAAEQVATVPGVVSATVKLEWPNSAKISIREDTPVLIWEEDGEIFWVTADGRLTPARIDVPGLLHIRVGDENADEGPSPEAMTATEERGAKATAEAEVDRAMDTSVPPEVLQGALQLRALRPNIDSLTYDISGGLSYQDGRGWRAYFGTGEDMAEKLAVYEALVEHLLAQQETPAYISVSNQEKPFYMTRDS